MVAKDIFRVIIADDEGVIRMGLKAMVQALGHKVVATARTGEEAIEKVKQFQPDVLLLDIKMPEMDGLTAAEILSKESPLPIVMLSAYSQKALIDQAANTLVMGYLVKPVYEAKLAPSLDLAVARFKELSTTASEVTELKSSLEGRDYINQAKQQLMAQGMSEDEAYHHLQIAARKRQVPMAEQAERMVKNSKGAEVGD